MISVSQVMTRGIEPFLMTQTVGEAIEILQNSGLPGLPVVDKDHKLQGVVFWDNRLLEVSPHTSLGK